VKDTTETAIALVCMLTMFGLGFYLNDGDQITYEVEQGDLSYQHINYTGEIRRGPYRFEFKKHIEPPERYGNQTVVIYGEIDTDLNIIKIRTGRSAENIVETCRHEIVHDYFPDYRHPDFTKPRHVRSDDPVYRLEDKVDFGICEDVAAHALNHQDL